jgi:allantoin racemase
MSTPEVAYLVPGVGLPDEERARRERVANDLTTGSVTVVETTAPGPSSIESGVEEAWAAVSAARSGYELREEFDAIVIGCFGDPGLRALRELVDIPVVGPAQATFYTAAQVADRFGWLTILDSTLPMSHEQAHEYGLADRCVSVRSVDAPVESIDHDSDDLVDRMVEVGRAAVEEDGAEALFPGCMSLSFAQRHDEIRDRVGVPFLDPAGIALEQATTWARHGLRQSRRTYPEAPFEKLDGLLGAQAPPADD